MKTLLLIINRKYGGGAERVFEIIRQGFDQSEYKVVVLYTHQKMVKYFNLIQEHMTSLMKVFGIFWIMMEM